MSRSAITALIEGGLRLRAVVRSVPAVTWRCRSRALRTVSSVQSGDFVLDQSVLDGGAVLG